MAEAGNHQPEAIQPRAPGERYQMIAARTDELFTAALEKCALQQPDMNEAILAGVVSALVRFTVQRCIPRVDLRVVTIGRVMGLWRPVAEFALTQAQRNFHTAATAAEQPSKER